MTSPTAADLGDAIRRTCRETGVTQKQIAEVTGKDQSTVSAWMKGENWAPLSALPQIDALCRMPRGHILREAGFIDEDTVDVAHAITIDPAIVDDLDRRAMLMHYSVVRSRSAS